MTREAKVSKWSTKYGKLVLEELSIVKELGTEYYKKDAVREFEEDKLWQRLDKVRKQLARLKKLDIELQDTPTGSRLELVKK